MNVPLLTELIVLVESLFKHHAPEVVKAVETAAVETAAQSAVADPRVQAGIAAYNALQEFKSAIQTPPTPPAA